MGRERRNAEVRRAEILAVTVRQIRQLGMDRTRVQDVAHALGVSTGLVFYHFNSKDKLLAAALEYAVDRDLARLDRALARSRTPTERLRRVLATYAPTGTAPGWTLWIEAWSVALRHPPIREMLRTLDARWRAALTGAIRDGVATGEFTCDEPATTAARIAAHLDGLSVAVVIYRSITKAQLRAWTRVTVAAELGIDPKQLA